MKSFPSLILAALFAGGLSSCKTDDEYPEFGVPEEDPGFFSRERRDKRADSWHNRRADWAKREDEAWDRIFSRAKGEF